MVAVAEDPRGLETLETMALAPAFNNWMFSVVEKYCRGHILEMGAGTGNLSSLFLNAGYDLDVSDLRTEYCALLESFKNTWPDLRVFQIDLLEPGFEKKFDHLQGTYDAVFALNVLEHIQDEGLALQNALSLLKTGGALIILVPAFQFAFSPLDRELGHYRRYTRQSLCRAIKSQGGQIQESRYFNLLGLAGWLVSGKIFGSTRIRAGQIKFFDRLVWLAKGLDVLFMKIAGLSVIAVARKE